MIVGIGQETSEAGMVHVLVVDRDKTVAEADVHETILPALRLFGDILAPVLGGEVRWVGRAVTPLPAPAGLAGTLKRVLKFVAPARATR